MMEGGKTLFQSDKIAVALAARPAVPGHVLVMPRQHFPIMEQVPDHLAGLLFSAANKVSTTLFEVLRAQGTNIVVENGTAAGQAVPHFAISVIPRSENDGIGLGWEPRKLSDDEMATAEVALTQESSKVSGFEKEEKKPLRVNARKETLVKEDYLVRQLRRIP